MDRHFMCPDCGLEHDDPADARLGHRVPCLDCSPASAFERHSEDVREPAAPIAA